MIGELCKECNNYFVYDRKDMHFGDFAIVNGALDVSSSPMLLNGQYFRIVGSVFNDGVYKYPATGLKDEEFNGAIWSMSVPPDFVDLAKEIEDWLKLDDVKKSIDSPYQSESFGGYSYSKESGTDGSGGVTWQTHFASKLNVWRKATVFK